MDLTQWITPEKIGIVGLLVIAVIAFFRTWILPITTHNIIVGKCVEENSSLAKKLDAALAEGKAARDELIALLKRQVELTQQQSDLTRQALQLQIVQKPKDGV